MTASFHRPRAPKVSSEAITFLREALRDGPVDGLILQQRALDEHGIGATQLLIAAIVLHVHVRRDAESNKLKVWYLPDPQGD